MSNSNQLRRLIWNSGVQPQKASPIIPFFKGQRLFVRACFRGWRGSVNLPPLTLDADTLTLANVSILFTVKQLNFKINNHILLVSVSHVTLKAVTLTAPLCLMYSKPVIYGG